MKRIGIIGGMSYESTLHYYEQINRQVNERAGGLVSADLVLRSVNFEDYANMMDKGKWDTIGLVLSREAEALCLFGDVPGSAYCDYIAIATNTMHKVAPEIERSLAKRWEDLDNQIQAESHLVHIGDCIAEKCQELNAKRVLLLGTKFTMTEDFLSKRLKSHGISVMDTSSYLEEIDKINQIIFDELCHGIVVPESKEFIINFICQFPCDSNECPDAVILGCTELNMIIKPEDVDIPLVDSTQAHIDKLVNLCFSDE